MDNLIYNILKYYSDNNIKIDINYFNNKFKYIYDNINDINIKNKIQLFIKNINTNIKNINTNIKNNDFISVIISFKFNLLSYINILSVLNIKNNKDIIINIPNKDINNLINDISLIFDTLNDNIKYVELNDDIFDILYIIIDVNKIIEAYNIYSLYEGILKNISLKINKLSSFEIIELLSFDNKKDIILKGVEHMYTIILHFKELLKYNNIYVNNYIYTLINTIKDILKSSGWDIDNITEILINEYSFNFDKIYQSRLDNKNKLTFIDNNIVNMNIHIYNFIKYIYQDNDIKQQLKEIKNIYNNRIKLMK